MQLKEKIDDSSVSACIEFFLQSLAAKNYSPKSLSIYKTALNRCDKWLTLSDIGRVQDVTLSHPNAWQASLTEKGLSPATSEIFLRTVRLFFRHLEAEDRIFASPAADLIIPGYERSLGAVPSITDIIRLLIQPDIDKATGIRDRAFMETAYSCALRHGELAGLTLSSPDINQKTLRVTGKGNRERVVPLGRQAVYWLEQYLETARPALIKDPNELALWINKNTGGKLGYHGTGRVIRQHAKSARLGNLSPQHIRRACATHMLQNGAHPSQIQALLGHSDLRNLGQYLRLTIADMKRMHKRSRPGQ